MPFTFKDLFSGDNLQLRKTNASVDSKVRALDAYAVLTTTQAHVADMFRTSQASISRWGKEALVETISDCPITSRRCLSEEEIQELLLMVEKSPRAFLRELRVASFLKFNKSVSISSLHRVLEDAGVSRKKCSLVMRIASRQLICNFVDYWNKTIGLVRHSQLVFVDELSFRAHRTHGRSPKGVPVPAFQRTMNKTISCAIAIDVNGTLLTHSVVGHFDRLSFTSFLRNLIASRSMHRFPGPRSILIVDGCRIHFSPDIFEAFRKCGIRYIKLPPYCPEMNPIEVFFSILRAKVRESSELFPESTPEQLINAELLRLTPRDCSSLFSHAGYCHGQFYSSPYIEGPKAGFLGNSIVE
ncbi:hypothetical protein RCL1_006839 [Eukaryota sp. TZLM3-RCL]